MKKIALTKGQYAVVDNEDFDRLSAYKWRCDEGYARRSQWSKNGKVTTVAMHREVMRAPHGKLVDHVNGNKLDNRKSNLRLANKSLNAANGRPHKDNSTGLKGVSPTKRGWLVRIMKNRVTYRVGVFPSLNEAGKAYNAKALELFGEFALLNKL